MCIRDRGDVAEVEGGEAEGEEAEGEQVTGTDLVGEEADDGHAADSAQAARSNDEAGGEGGVAEEFLEEEREHGDGGVDADAEEEDEEAPDAVVAVFEELQVDHWLFFAPGVPDEDGKAGDEEEEGPADPDGAEPVILLAFVEDDLQEAGPCLLYTSTTRRAWLRIGCGETTGASARSPRCRCQ